MYSFEKTMFNRNKANDEENLKLT